MSVRAGRLHPVMLRSLWAYRGFVLGAVRREFQARYRGSLLGGIWAIVNPLAQILVFTLIFAELMKARLPGHEGSVYAYSIYLCAGILSWGLFAEVLGRLTTVFLENGNLIKKASFPRVALPTVVVLTALVNFAIIMTLFLLFQAITGSFPGAVVLALLPVVAVLIAFAAGLGLLLGTLNVFFRDVGQLTGVVLTFWFWLTPIIYLESAVPPRAQSLLAANPMTPVVHAFQRVLLDGQLPDWLELLPVAVGSLALLLFSGLFFLRQSAEIVDEL